MAITRSIVMQSLIAGALIAAVCGSGLAAQTLTLVSIGTGSVAGVYYPTGGAICRLVNRQRSRHGIHCSVVSTAGSIDNLDALRSGALQMGVVQSDWQYHAYHGSDRFAAAGAFEELRALFSVHPEPVTIVARADSGIRRVADLRGRRFHVGNPGSGTRASWAVLAEAFGLSHGDPALMSELQSAEIAQALCDNKIDAFMMLIGHPSGLVEDTASACDVRLVAIEGPEVDTLVADGAFYRKVIIPGGRYRGNPNDTPTYGVGATVVTSAEAPADVVYSVVKAVFEQLDRFRALHPAFADLQAAQMVSDSLTAPLHDGAVRYYRERGWWRAGASSNGG